MRAEPISVTLPPQDTKANIEIHKQRQCPMSGMRSPKWVNVFFRKLKIIYDGVKSILRILVCNLGVRISRRYKCIKRPCGLYQNDKRCFVHRFHLFLKHQCRCTALWPG
jgi:hypothetical protein